MRKKWKALWARRPRLGRGGKTVRNLLLALALAILVWGQYGCPLPTAELEFRRAERRNLLPRSEIVFASTGRGEKYIGRESGQSVSLWKPVFIGVAGDGVTAAYGTRQWTVDRYPLEEGPTPASFGYAPAVVFGPGVQEFRFPLMFISVPQGADRAELEFRIVYRGKEHFWSGQGFDLGGGTWLFPLETPEVPYGDYWWRGGGYVLRLYRADGSPLLEQSGTIPE